MVKIPLSNDSSQKFSVILDKRAYVFVLSWNSRGSMWVMDVLTPNFVEIIRGVKVVPNLDLLSRFADPLLPPGALMVLSKKDLDRDISSKFVSLVYLTKEETDAI